MKAIFIDNHIGAFLNFRQEVVSSFEKDGWEVAIILPSEDLKTIYMQNMPSHWKIHGLNLARDGVNPIKDFVYIKELISVFKKEKPDIVMTYTVKPNIYGSIACTVCGIPCLSMMAGLGFLFEGNGLKKKLGRALYKFAVKKTKKVTVLNKSNYDQLISANFINPDNLILLEGGEGVDLKKYSRKETNYDDVRFLMIARLIYDKGYQEYVDAARIVKQKYPNVKIELLGAPWYASPMGVPMEVLEKDMKEGAITYLGETTDVPSYMNRPGTVIVIPSKYLEGLNRSLMEACSMGCPIITTDIPGCRETINKGKNGFLIPKGNSEKLAQAMIKMIELSPKERVAMALESRRLAEQKFDVNHVIDTYKKLTFDVLSNIQ